MALPLAVVCRCVASVMSMFCFCVGFVWLGCGFAVAYVSVVGDHCLCLAMYLPLLPRCHTFDLALFWLGRCSAFVLASPHVRSQSFALEVTDKRTYARAFLYLPIRPPAG